MRFRGLLKGSDTAPLDGWLNDAASSGIHGMRQFGATLRQDLAAVRNAISEPWSNGQTEGQINRLKTLKRAIYGRARVELLRARMLPFRLCGSSSLAVQAGQECETADASPRRVAGFKGRRQRRYLRHENGGSLGSGARNLRL